MKKAAVIAGVSTSCSLIAGTLLEISPNVGGICPEAWGRVCETRLGGWPGQTPHQGGPVLQSVSVVGSRHSQPYAALSSIACNSAT